jgi:2'-5' RNA ligase
MADMWRLFIAIELSDEMKASLAKVVSLLNRRSQSAVRWTDVANLHLTLKFLGDTPSQRVPELTQAIEQASQGIPPFTLELGNPGAFPNNLQPRVLWVGLAGDYSTLARLQQRVEDACEALGFPREGRRFVPHLTLGRVRDTVPDAGRRQVGEMLATCRVEPAGQQVESVCLVRSTLTPQGPVYTRLAQVVLNFTLSKGRG